MKLKIICIKVYKNLEKYPQTYNLDFEVFIQGSCGSLKVLESVSEGPWKCLN